MRALDVGRGQAILAAEADRARQLFDERVELGLRSFATRQIAEALCLPSLFAQLVEACAILLGYETAVDSGLIDPERCAGSSL